MNSDMDEFGQSLMLILSSPSGTGKSTLAKMLFEKSNNFGLSISCTTRKMREGEIDGKDYHFVSPEEYAKIKDMNGFLEFAQVHGNSYGTPKNQILELCQQKKDVLFDIDWQGAAQLKRRFREVNFVSIFLLPPSLPTLYDRLKRRAKDDLETINRRMHGAIEEIKHYNEYNYVITNDDLNETFNKIYTIYLAEKEKINTFYNTPKKVEELMTGSSKL